MISTRSSHQIRLDGASGKRNQLLILVVEVRRQVGPLQIETLFETDHARVQDLKRWVRPGPPSTWATLHTFLILHAFGSEKSTAISHSKLAKISIPREQHKYP